MTDYGAGTEHELSHNLPNWFYIANCSVSLIAHANFLILKGEETKYTYTYQHFFA